MKRLVPVVRSRSAPRLAVFCACAAGLVALAPAAQARTLQMFVTFSPTGTISLTLPDGTPVGTTSGSPTVIPAGYYTLQMSGPGACTQLPAFELKGPGVNVYSDMTAGEVDQTSEEAFFKPSSTYTWRNDGTPGVVYTFATSATVEGTISPGPPAGTGMKSTVSSSDLVGSEIGPFRGTLKAGVSAAGRLALSFKGKSVGRLKAGRYRISVVDRSSTSGLFLKKQKAKGAAVELAGGTFTGTRSERVRLTAGTWLVQTRLGKTAYSISVR